MKYVRTLIVLAALCCLGSTVLADDLNPPTWRGQDGSTFQAWEFSTDANPAAPTVAVNPYGPSMATIDFNEPFGSGWWDSLSDVYGSKQGWWDIGMGSITLTIPNRVTTAPLSYKDIRVQVTFWKDISESGTISITPNATQVGTYQSSLVEGGPMGGGWYTMVSNWHMEPNPDSETITILADPMWGTMIDEIVVDTICVAVPEPGSLMTLAAGIMGIAGLAFRRRS